MAEDREKTEEEYGEDNDADYEENRMMTMMTMAELFARSSSSTSTSSKVSSEEQKQLQPLTSQHNDNRGFGSLQQQEQEQSPSRSLGTLTRHPAKGGTPYTHPRNTASVPTLDAPTAIVPATMPATRRRLSKEGNTSDEVGMMFPSLHRSVVSQLPVLHPEEEHRADALAATPFSSTNVRPGNKNVPGSATLSRQQQQQQDDASGDSSVTTLSISDRPGAFRIHPNGQDDVPGNDDDETLILHDVENSLVTQSSVPPANDNTNNVSLSSEDQLPIAQTLEDDALEREVLDRVRSRQPVVQAEKISPPSPSKTKGWVPIMVAFVFLSALLLVTLAGTGILFQNPKDDADLSILTSTTPPTILEGKFTTTVDIEPVVQWLDPFLANHSFSIPSDTSSPQYRAVEWLATYHPPLNAVTNDTLNMWIQYYVLVTLYYSTGGETGTWFNDRLWLSPEPFCDWALISCSNSGPTNYDLFQNNNMDNQNQQANDPSSTETLRTYVTGVLLRKWIGRACG
jgi:hypothetical protein